MTLQVFNCHFAPDWAHKSPQHKDDSMDETTLSIKKTEASPSPIKRMPPLVDEKHQPISPTLVQHGAGNKPNSQDLLPKPKTLKPRVLDGRLALQLRTEMIEHRRR
jgi:hypothetical protein